MRNRIRRALRAVIAANGYVNRESGHSTIASRTPIQQVQGIIQQVDPVSRELPVLVDGVTVNFFVPLGCNIAVNDESVRLRILQPNDHVRLVYSVEHDITTAHSITVHHPTCG